MSIKEDQKIRIQKVIDKVKTLVNREGQEWVDVTLRALVPRLKRVPFNEKHFNSEMNCMERRLGLRV